MRHLGSNLAVKAARVVATGLLLDTMDGKKPLLKDVLASKTTVKVIFASASWSLDPRRSQNGDRRSGEAWHSAGSMHEET